MAFSYLLLFLLACLCAYIIWWTFRTPLRMYQLPFFVTIAYSIYIFPQLVGLIRDPFPVSAIYVDITILLTILSFFLFFWGYIRGGDLRGSSVDDTYPSLSDPDPRIFYLGIIYSIIGFLCSVAIGNVDLEQQQVSQWTGILTIYAFFQRTLYFGFAISLYFVLIKRRFIYWLVFGFTAFWPIFQFLFYARRTHAAVYTMVILTIIWFTRKTLPPRGLILICVVFGFFVINAIGAVRAELATLDLGYSNWRTFFGFDWLDDWLQAMQRVQWWEESTKLLQASGESGSIATTTFSETKYAASVIQATNETMQFDYGTGYWNRIIFGLVPAQFVGSDLKASLMFNFANSSQQIVFDYFSFQTYKTGYTFPIIGEIFYRFWFFGFFLCYYIGLQFKRFWISVNRCPVLSNRIVYPIALVFTFSLIIGGTSGFFFNMLNFFIFSIPVKYIESLNHTASNTGTIPKISTTEK